MSQKKESDNPLLDKKVVRKVLKTHEYSTPWDQPIYQETIVSNQKYSKIESVFEIPYLRDAPDYRSGDFMHRFNICVEKKKNLKQTLDDIKKRYDEIMVVFNKDLDRIFAGTPSQEDKMRLKELIVKMMGIYHEFREVEHYDDIIQKEVDERKLTFDNEEEKEKFDDGMAILKKAFPFQQTIAYQKMNDDFRRIINRFFLEKNMRFYKPKEIDDAKVYKERLMYKTN